MSLSTLELRRAHDAFHECPKCSRHALTQTSSGIYECIWCNFRRDVSQPRNGPLAFLGGIAGILVCLALL